MSITVSSIKQFVQKSSQLLLGIALVASMAACSKPEARLSIRAAESQKDLPSTALVRKIEIQYHDAAGGEKYRQSVPVYGMGQPISLQNDSLQKLEWDSSGVFTATAYTGDGLLLLQGVGRGNPESDAPVEVVLERQTGTTKDGAIRSTQPSVLLRQIRIFNVPKLEGYTVSSSELRVPKIHSVNEEGCIVVPEPVVLQADRGLWPAFRFESSIKAPEFRYAVARDGADPKSAQSVPLGGLADPEISLSPSFLEQNQLKPGDSFRLYLAGPGGEFEGCLVVRTAIEMSGPTVSFQPHSDSNPFALLKAEALLQVENPNAIPIQVSIDLSARTKAGVRQAIFWKTNSNGARSVEELQTVRDGFGLITVPPHSNVSFYFFGGYPFERPYAIDTYAQLQYQVTVKQIPPNGGVGPVLIKSLSL